MTDISKSELSRLLGDSHLGEEAYFLEVVSRWDCLRVLDYLFTEGPTSTGDLARGINMDMREVHETLKALAEIGVVSAEDRENTTYWQPTTTEVYVAMTSDNGLEITHTLQSSSQLENSPNSHDFQKGIFTKVGERFDRLLDRVT